MQANTTAKQHTQWRLNRPALAGLLVPNKG
jgi:hypothetical protein